MRGEAGFTLVEILVIILVIGLLATFGIVSLVGQRNNVNVRDVQVELDTAALRLSSFAEQNGLGERTVSTNPNSPITGGFAGLVDSSNQIKLDAVQKIVRGGSFVADDLTKTTDLPTKQVGITISDDRRSATLRKCMRYFKDKQSLCLVVEVNPFTRTGQLVRTYHRGSTTTPAGAFTDAAWGKEPDPGATGDGSPSPPEGDSDVIRGGSDAVSSSMPMNVTWECAPGGGSGAYACDFTYAQHEATPKCTASLFVYTLEGATTAQTDSPVSVDKKTTGMVVPGGKRYGVILANIECGGESYGASTPMELTLTS